MNIQNLTTTNGADQFYPTPPSVAEQMLQGIDWRMIQTVLEPSAGKGDLILAAARARYPSRSWTGKQLDVDAVEIDPYLREICKYNFSEARLGELWEPYGALQKLPYEEQQKRKDEMNGLRMEWDLVKSVDLHMVHDDFLTYHTYKHYDLILMNPPFSDGDKHLLHALEMQKDGGSVVCLLNAETIRNPYTATRQLLKRKLAELNAEIRYMDDAFSVDAERRAEVDVAIIKVYIPAAVHESKIYERMKHAQEAEHIPDPELQALVPGDTINQAVQMYNAEVAATMELVKEYNALKPYMTRSLTEETCGSDPILTLVVERDNVYGGFDYQKYMRMVRLKYWKALFHNEEFVGRLTSNLRKRFVENVERMANYEFSAFNIKQVLIEMNGSMQQGVQETILNLFDKLTAEHSWYPECANNRHYFNGWKTNQAHKIGKKSIIPANGMYSSYSWNKDESFSVQNAYDVLSDIEKAFDYLDGGHFSGNRYDLHSFLKYASEQGQNRNIECTYFKVDLFKKGTVHIKFRPEAMPLVERLNIYAAQNKNWLPPNYGKAKYADMTEEEKAVVDDFQGEEAYAEVMAQKGFYLADPVSNTPLLSA